MRRFDFWKRGPDPAPEPPGPAAAGAWEGRLYGIGSRLDAHPAPLQEVAVVVGGGEAWISALGLDPRRALPLWDYVSFRLELTEHAGEALPPLAGRWATILATVGRGFDLEVLPVAEPCIVERDGGLLVSGLVQEPEGWVLVNWRLTDEGVLR